MSDAYNPYASPNNNPIGAAPSSGAITAIGVVGIILGSLGLLVAEFSVVALLAQPAMLGLQQEFLKQAPADVRESQLKMQTDIADASRQAFIPQMIGMVIKFFAEIALITGSILVLKRTQRTIAVGGIIAAMVSDLYSAGVQIYVQLQMAPAVEKSMNEMMKAQGQNANAPDMSGIMKVGTIIGVGFGVVWLLIKLGFFGWALTYLNRDSTRLVFEGKNSGAS